jgi:uncharacterized membrane protein (UPF0127 family)
MRTFRALAVALLAGSVACDSRPAASDDDSAAYQNVMTFDTATVRLAGQRDTLNLALQLAVTSEQKTMGLMERTKLAPNAGMLFVYDSTQPPDAGFWMYRTRLPLDIAFLDSAGVIRSIKQMVPCPTTIAQGCPTYEPGVPYRYALEMNTGYFEQHGVGLGQTLLLQNLTDGRRPK